MKKKELKDLRVKDTEEMNKMLFEKKNDLSKVLVEMVASKEKNLKKAKKLKHDISQILTLMREREIINLDKEIKDSSLETKKDNIKTK